MPGLPPHPSLSPRVRGGGPRVRASRGPRTGSGLARPTGRALAEAGGGGDSVCPLVALFLVARLVAPVEAQQGAWICGEGHPHDSQALGPVGNADEVRQAMTGRVADAPADEVPFVFRQRGPEIEPEAQMRLQKLRLEIGRAHV